MTSNYLQKMKKNWKPLYTLLEYTVKTWEGHLAYKKIAMLVMKSGKWHLTDGMEIPNEDNMRTHAENETYKYLGVLEADTKWKWKSQKEHLRKTRKLPETKLFRRNVFKEINARAVPLVRYSGTFLKWTKD